MKIFIPTRNAKVVRWISGSRSGSKSISMTRAISDSFRTDISFSGVGRLRGHIHSRVFSIHASVIGHPNYTHVTSSKTKYSLPLHLHKWDIDMDRSRRFVYFDAIAVLD